MAKKDKENKEENVDQIESLLKEKEFKGQHYGSRSGEEIIKPDIISTGSFFFDCVLGGGFRSASWSRAVAMPENGKTSQGLCWGHQWQKYWNKKGKEGVVIAFNAEGRITPDLLIRSGIDTSKDKFRLIDTNRSDFIYTLIERLILDNPDDKHYFFIVDSTDACNRSQDSEKNIGEAEKIGGGATIISAAGKRLSLLFSLKKHHLYMTSQVRDKMTTGPGAGGKDASGGNAPKFYSSLVMKIEKHWSEHSILENPSDKKSLEIGRIVQIKLEKTYNESTGRIVTVPVKYGHIGGIWREQEAVMMTQAFGLIITNGPGRFELTERFLEDLKANNLECESKFHGEKAMRLAFEANPDLVEYIHTSLRQTAGINEV